MIPRALKLSRGTKESGAVQSSVLESLDVLPTDAVQWRQQHGQPPPTTVQQQRCNTDYNGLQTTSNRTSLNGAAKAHQ